MLFCVFCCNHCAQCKAVAVVRVVGDCYGIGVIIVVYDAVNAGDFVAAYCINLNLCGFWGIAFGYCAVGVSEVAHHPILLVRNILDNAFGKGYSCTAGCVELVDVMGLFNPDFVVVETVHYPCKILVHCREYCYAKAEVA